MLRTLFLMLALTAAFTVSAQSEFEIDNQTNLVVGEVSVYGGGIDDVEHCWMSALNIQTVTTLRPGETKVVTLSQTGDQVNMSMSTTSTTLIITEIQ